MKKSLLWWNERANLLAVVAIDKANSTGWNTEIPLRYRKKNLYCKDECTVEQAAQINVVTPSLDSKPDKTQS